MSGSPSRSRRLVRLLRRNRLSRQEIWERKWATKGSRAPWELEDMPAVVGEALVSDWFRRGTSLVDIGCGSGELAAMLSEEGFDTLGIDFAASAIELARASHIGNGHPANLRFEVVDICGDTSQLGVFENLIDRGCFHGLDVTSHQTYGRNVAALSAPGAPFLMMCRLREVSASTREKHVRESLEGFFLFEEIEEVKIDYDGGGIDGLAFWMIRR